MSAILEPMYARGAVAGRLRDPALARAMLRVEGALAQANAALGEIPSASAERIRQACARPGLAEASLEALARSVAENATPVPGLLEILRGALPEADREHLHRGATSQDVVDTALTVLAAEALDALEDELRAASAACARLAAEHRATAMIARTLLQQALPTTFGLVAAGWLDGLDQVHGHLRHVRGTELAVQMGGPVGGAHPAVAERVAAELGLAIPVMGWATIRVRPGLLAGVLGLIAGVAGKIARDVTLLGQGEVGELAEGRAGASSAMAHKRNPTAAVSALACAKRVPGLVATMLAAMEQEEQRAAGAWQAEWGTQRELLELTGSALAWLGACLDGLRVDPARMAANLARATGGGDAAPAGVQALIDRALGAHASLGA